MKTTINLKASEKNQLSLGSYRTINQFVINLWGINIDLDSPFFTEIKSISNPQWNK